MSAFAALFSRTPLSVGHPAPRLSLTADSGKWVRIDDHIGRQQVLLVFLRRLDNTRAEWLGQVASATARLTQADTVVYGVHTARTDRLRAFRNAAQVEVPLCYDPFGIESRAWRATSRWRPSTRDMVVLVNVDGGIAWAKDGLPSPDDVTAAIRTARGLDAPAAEVSPETVGAGVRHIDSAEAVQLIEEQNYRLLDVRTASEYEADHAPMAIHIPLDELPQRAAELGDTRKILCVCQAGGRSQAAAEFLVSIGGHDIFNVVGGMSAWSGPRVTGGEGQ